MLHTQFEISFLDRLFPFFFVVNADGKVVHFGTSLQKLVRMTAPVDFDQLLEIERPTGVSLNELISSGFQEVVAVNVRGSSAKLMGQILPTLTQDLKVFVMNLVVQEVDELIDLGLDFTDFAVQDPIFDYLMLLQTQRRAIRQADEANHKLAEAHQVALEASEAKSQFLANMSHELRTPMNGLLGMASILQDTQLDDEQRDYVNTLVQSGEAMLALVNDILDLSKIEAGFISLSTESVDLRAIVDEVARTVYPVVEKKRLQFQTQVHADCPQLIVSDPVRLRQVILNLVGNAVKFTSSGGDVLLFVDRKIRPHGPPWLEFRVKDSGIGMSPETLSQIFSPFVQGDSSMTKKFEGTGLGLSICKKLVEAMGGDISVSSQEGLGSEFRFNIPLNEPDET